MTEPTETAARVVRAARKAELARTLTLALASHDITQAELAASCGVGPQLVQRWCDRDRTEKPAVADLRLMPRPIAVALVQWAVEDLDLQISDLLDPADMSHGVAVIGRAMAEMGQAVDGYLSAVSDGHLSRAEAAKCVDELGEVIALLTALREACCRAERAGGSVVDLTPRARGGAA